MLLNKTNVYGRYKICLAVNSNLSIWNTFLDLKQMFLWFEKRLANTDCLLEPAWNQVSNTEPS